LNPTANRQTTATTPSTINAGVLNNEPSEPTTLLMPLNNASTGDSFVADDVPVAAWLELLYVAVASMALVIASVMQVDVTVN
jgi:hypothetical protein